jgi:hypothetical protein
VCPLTLEAFDQLLDRLRHPHAPNELQLKVGSSRDRTSSGNPQGNAVLRRLRDERGDQVPTVSPSQSAHGHGPPTHNQNHLPPQPQQEREYNGPSSVPHPESQLAIPAVHDEGCPCTGCTLLNRGYEMQQAAALQVNSVFREVAVLMQEHERDVCF